MGSLVKNLTLDGSRRAAQELLSFLQARKVAFFIGDWSWSIEGLRQSLEHAAGCEVLLFGASDVDLEKTVELLRIFERQQDESDLYWKLTRWHPLNFHDFFLLEVAWLNADEQHSHVNPRMTPWVHYADVDVFRSGRFEKSAKIIHVGLPLDLIQNFFLLPTRLKCIGLQPHY